MKACKINNFNSIQFNSQLPPLSNFKKQNGILLTLTLERIVFVLNLSDSLEDQEIGQTVSNIKQNEREYTNERRWRNKLAI